MRVARPFTSAAATKRHMVQQRDIVAHDSGLTDDHARGMVDHYPHANLCSWVDVNRHDLRHPALNCYGEGLQGISNVGQWKIVLSALSTAVITECMAHSFTCLPFFHSQ